MVARIAVFICSKAGVAKSITSTRMTYASSRQRFALPGCASRLLYHLGSTTPLSGADIYIADFPKKISSIESIDRLNQIVTIFLGAAVHVANVRSKEPVDEEGAAVEVETGAISPAA